ncbi:MAG: hypothetical protein V7K47_22230 [Nostoc sp.]
MPSSVMLPSKALTAIAQQGLGQFSQGVLWCKILEMVHSPTPVVTTPAGLINSLNTN